MRGRSFYIPFEWLQDNWSDIHGAFHVNVKRIGGSSTDARRLARYLVSQYCGDQSGLVRLSQSKTEQPFSKMREALRREVRTMPERYEFAATLAHLPPDEFAVQFKKAVWLQFKAAWGSLVQVGVCDVFGVRLVWFAGRLERL
ncbi:MAG: hypothetical protein WCL27_11850 [Betaproteobacteria bacterium]